MEHLKILTDQGVPLSSLCRELVSSFPFSSSTCLLSLFAADLGKQQGYSYAMSYSNIETQRWHVTSWCCHVGLSRLSGDLSKQSANWP